MITILLALVTFTPRFVTCPFDGMTASYTGKTRKTVDGITECRYKHIHFHSTQYATLVEESHVIWAPCAEEKQ